LGQLEQVVELGAEAVGAAGTVWWNWELKKLGQLEQLVELGAEAFGPAGAVGGTGN
jgi:hypothetical protein